MRTNYILDSGATTCFLDEIFSHTHSIPKLANIKPIPIEVIDERPLLSAAITQGTTPLELIVGSHRETIAFDLISSPRHPVILGLSWLITHNPIVDWRGRSIVLSTPVEETTYSSVASLVANSYFTTNNVLIAGSSWQVTIASQLTKI